MAHLYVNSKGYPVTRHSVSASGDFHWCPQFYHLKRVVGYQDKGRRASLEFGKCIENAVRYHHETGSGASEAFSKLWDVHKANTELTYTATEGSWEDLALSGREMIRLYEISSFQLRKPKFQVSYSREIFPGTMLAGITFVAYIDAETELIDRYDGGPVPLIVDIKTSSGLLPGTPGILSLDPQLQTYAWAAGIPNVGFLNFVKTSRSLQKGAEIILLQDAGEFKLGQRAIVADNKSEDDPANKQPIALLTEQQMDEMKNAIGPKPTSKQGKENKTNFLTAHATFVPESFVTKQRLQFLTAYIDADAQAEAAQKMQQDVLQIVHANKNNYWPKIGGIRFPNNKCVSCSMRGICLKNNILRDELVEMKDADSWGINLDNSDE